MKIYLLKVDNKYQIPPKKMNPFMPHSNGFNVETGFLQYLLTSKLLTENPNEADWHYLPIMWSFWQLGNNYGKDNREEMQEYLNKIILDSHRTFTVSEADNEPGFEIGNTKVFSANQSVGYHDHKWIPVPIITLPHQLPTVQPSKKYISNFVGNTKAWETRRRMVELLKDRKDVKIIESRKGETVFVNTILESYTTLCPRGSALGSYRFYESMQLGVVPIMISDEDFRPFPDKITWHSCSYFVDSPDKLPVLLDSEDFKDPTNLKVMGDHAKQAWTMLFENWPDYVLDSLLE